MSDLSYDFYRKLRRWLSKAISEKLGRRAQLCGRCGGLGYELLQEHDVHCAVCQHDWTVWLAPAIISSSETCPGCGSIIGYPDNAIIFAKGREQSEPPFKCDTFAASLPLFEAFQRWMASDGTQAAFDEFCEAAQAAARAGRAGTGESPLMVERAGPKN